MSRLLSLASGVVPELSPVATAEAAARGGWPAVGLWVEPAEWTAQTTRDVREALQAGGLEVLDVEVVWLQPGPPDPGHERIIDVGAEVGARNVLVVSSDPDHGAATAKFARLCGRGDARRGSRCAAAGLRRLSPSSVRGRPTCRATAGAASDRCGS